MKLFFIILLTAVFVLSCGEDGEAGAAGTDGALIKLTQEAENTENCDGNGGTKVETGTDVNSDGILDEEEITSTSFICNGDLGEEGTSGSTGTDASTTLVNVTDEPTGTENCEGKGGKRIEAGIDDNEDGTLQEDEIDSAEFVCNEYENIYYGDMTIVTNKDIENLSKYEMVVGNLYFDSEIADTDNFVYLTEISVSGVRKVTGSIIFGSMHLYKYISDSLLEKIEFPDLEEVGVSFYLSYLNSLTSLELPKLKEVGTGDFSPKKAIKGGYYGESGLTIMENEIIENISFPSLEKGSVFISDNDNLKSIDLSGLKDAESSTLYFYNNPLLTSLNLSNLENILSIRLSDLPELTTLDLNSFKGTIITSIYINELSKLTALNFSALQKASYIYIMDMNLLTSISLPELISVNDIHFDNNPELITITEPKLTSIKYFYFKENDKLETIALPEVISINEMNISSNALLTSFNMPKLETAGSSYFNIYNNESLSECTLLDFINSLTNVPDFDDISGNKPCKCYEYNSAETDDYSNYEDFAEFMNSGSWSIAEKMIIPATDTDVVYPHLYRGVNGSPLEGDFKISVDGVNHTISASLYDGTTWKELSGTDDKIKPSAILSIILNYDVSTTTFSLYLNGTMIDSDSTVATVDDSLNSSDFYVAASNDGTDMTNYVPYIFLQHKFIQRALTEVEITIYTEATSDLLPVIDAENREINFMDGALIDSVGITIVGSPVQKSVLDTLPLSL